MASLEIIALILTGLGLTASIMYYAGVLSDASRTRRIQLESRQIQLFMQLLSRYQDPEFHHNAEHEMLLKWEWDDYEHFIGKYGLKNNPEAWKIFDSTLTWIDGIGILVKRGHLDPEIVNDTLFAFIEHGWEKFGPIIIEHRKKINYPQAYTNFEYLYNVTKPLTEKLRNINE